MFVVRFNVERAAGLLSRADTLTIDTVQLADEFRTDDISIRGVFVDATDRKVTVDVVVSPETDVPLPELSDVPRALKANMRGGEITGDARIKPDFTSQPGIRPERNKELNIDWE